MSTTEPPPSADDTLYGVAAIAECLRSQGLPFSDRQTFYALEKSNLPGGKLGGRWIASRSALASHIERIAAGRPA
jgi:hypothetical protein